MLLPAMGSEARIEILDIDIFIKKWKKYGKTGENDKILQLFLLEIYMVSCRFRKKNKSLLTKEQIGNKIDTR